MLFRERFFMHLLLKARQMWQQEDRLRELERYLELVSDININAPPSSQTAQKMLEVAQLARQFVNWAMSAEDYYENVGLRYPIAADVRSWVAALKEFAKDYAAISKARRGRVPCPACYIGGGEDVYLHREGDSVWCDECNFRVVLNGDAEYDEWEEELVEDEIPYSLTTPPFAEYESEIWEFIGSGGLDDVEVMLNRAAEYASKFGAHHFGERVNQLSQDYNEVLEYWGKGEVDVGKQLLQRFGAIQIKGHRFFERGLANVVDNAARQFEEVYLNEWLKVTSKEAKQSAWNKLVQAYSAVVVNTERFLQAAHTTGAIALIFLPDITTPSDLERVVNAITQLRERQSH